MVLSFSLTNCSKKEKPAKYVAKVNKSVLTEEDVNLALADERYKNLYREEFINSWIKTEVLFQEAADKGILNEREYKSLYERSKKELAAALFIQKIMTEKSIEPTDDEIIQYYNQNKDDFKFIDDAYKINQIQFNNYDIAVQFRNALIENEWDRAFNKFRNEKSIVEYSQNKLLFKYQIQPVSLTRIIPNMALNEISVVIETEPMKYSVVQLIDKYVKDTIPHLELVKEDVKKRLAIVKKNQYLKEYIDKLIADHNSEIVRYSE